MNPVDEQLEEFLAASRFREGNAVLTDLDGTALHEHEGRLAIASTVSHGLTHLRDLGHQIVVNTLRFPLNVARTFGREWYAITDAPLPLVSLNGSAIGWLRESATGEIGFEEAAAFPLAPSEIGEVVRTVEGLLERGLDDFALFFYPRDWRAGEIVWTPSAERVPALREKYVSACEVLASSATDLRERMLASETCMTFILVERSGDDLMAYQHARPGQFTTRAGVDKLSGAKAAAVMLGIDLTHSVGAGDTPMDNFLDGVGLAVHVGPLALEFRGRHQTVRVGDSLELGELLYRLADLQRVARGAA
jgi:hypothetical protein